MKYRDWYSYSKFLLLAHTVMLAAATVQQSYFVGHIEWRFYGLPILVAMVFGLLLGRIEILKLRLDRQHHRQAQMVDEHAWKIGLQQQVIEHLNRRHPLPQILDTLLHGLSERYPSLAAAIFCGDAEREALQPCVSTAPDGAMLQAVFALEAEGRQALLLAATKNLPLDGQVRELEAELFASGYGTCWCQEIGEGERRAGLLLLGRHDGMALSWSELEVGKALVPLALLAIVQHRHEAELEARHEQLSALLEALPDAIFFKDGVGRWLFINDAARDLFQLQGLAWQGLTDAELAAMRPAFRDAHLACIDDDEAAWQRGELCVFDEQMLDGEGKPHFFEVRKKPLFEACGQRKALVVIGRDVTERVLSEAELRIAAITFESQEGMLISDARGQILRANRAFLMQTGYHAEDVVGRHVRSLRSGRHESGFYQNMWRIIEEDGFWQGEIWNRRKDGEIYPVWLSITAVHDREGRLSNFVATYSDVTERKEAEKKIRNLAFYDPLTSLPNRRLLQDRLQHALMASQRKDLYGALLFIDLDNFKTLNDTQGHLVGDQLLIEVAERLRQCVREQDTVARLGGDEFVVLLEQLHEDEQHAALLAGQVGEKLFAAINRPFLLAENDYHSSPSIGVSLFSHEDKSGDELLKRADMAMYQAKADGRNTMRFFDPSMQRAVEAKARLESDLHRALEQGELLLNYQIQVNGDGSIHGAEALVRWEHPVHGLIPPSEFVPVAEETSLILPVGQWVLEEVCRLLHEVNGTALEHVRVAVNISARQFRQKEFVQQVRDALRCYALAPHRLKLELTESMVIDDIDDTVRKMHELRELGCRFSLDDFGTGYSSLAYLRRLPLDEVKIDKSFVQHIVEDPNDDAIVRAIIALASSLGLNTVAEGVETEEQRRVLARHGCTTYQGYLFGHPLDRAAFIQRVTG